MSEAIAFIAGLVAMMIVWFINDNSTSASPYRRGFEDGYRKAMKDYEQKADDVKVGDEVRLCRHKVTYIVTSCDGDDDTYILMTVNGGFIKAGKYNVRKTGRRFGIGKILEEMRT